MLSRNRVAFFALAFAGLAFPGFAQQYYVDAENGSDSSDGTLSRPWRTVSHALTGSHDLPEGASIYLLGTSSQNYSVANGEQFPWRLHHGINLFAHPQGGANYVVDGLDMAAALVEFEPGLPASGTIRGLTFRNAERGIVIHPEHGVVHAPRIEHCTFYMLPKEAVHVLAPDGAEASAAVVRNYISECGFDDGSHSIHIEDDTGGSSASLLESNTIQDDPAVELTTGGVYVKGGSTNHPSAILRFLQIYKNLILDTKGDGLVLDGAAAVAVHDNAVTGNAGYGVRIASGSSNLRLIGNRLNANRRGGLRDESGNAIVATSNEICANGGAGVELAAAAPLTPPRYVNNTIVDNAGVGFWSTLASGAPVLVNSIVWGNAAGDVAGFGAGQVLASVVGAGAPAGGGNLALDPQLTADYRLQPHSPCIDAGIPSWVDWGADLDGTPRELDGDFSGGVAVDIGAREFAAGSVRATLEANRVVVHIEGAEGLQYALFSAIAEDRSPLDPSGELVDPVFGTLLLDPACMPYSTPLASGRIGAGGATLSLPLPYDPRATTGSELAFQAVLRHTNGAGQATNAAAVQLPLTE